MKCKNAKSGTPRRAAGKVNIGSNVDSSLKRKFSQLADREAAGNESVMLWVALQEAFKSPFFLALGDRH